MLRAEEIASPIATLPRQGVQEVYHMIEIQCPWCEESGLAEAAAFSAAETVLRCDGCGVAAEVSNPPPPALALAA